MTPGTSTRRPLPIGWPGLTPRPTIRILRLPDLGDGEDLVEFAGEYRDTLSADAIRAEIEALAAKTEPERPKPAPGSAVLLTMASIESAAIEWLWPGRIAMGSVTMLNAHPGAGKTTLMHDLAARVSSGVGWPDNPLQAQPVGGVVLLHCEDDLSRVVRPRLELARADLTRIIALRGVHTEDDTEGFFDLGRNLPALRQAIREAPDCRLVVIDPLGHSWAVLTRIGIARLITCWGRLPILPSARASPSCSSAT